MNFIIWWDCRKASSLCSWSPIMCQTSAWGYHMGCHSSHVHDYDHKLYVQYEIIKEGQFKLGIKLFTLLILWFIYVCCYMFM